MSTCTISSPSRVGTMMECLGFSRSFGSMKKSKCTCAATSEREAQGGKFLFSKVAYIFRSFLISIESLGMFLLLQLHNQTSILSVISHVTKLRPAASHWLQIMRETGALT